VAIFGLGPVISLAAELQQQLAAEGFSAALINPRFVKPIDLDAIARFAKSARVFVTFEDHALMGGFGSAVLEALDQLGLNVPVVRIGWPDQFIEHGKVDQLRVAHGLSVQAALDQLHPLLARLADQASETPALTRPVSG
jgi:1-deoxy-D-xylulose-5-phosphate synthase